MKSKAPPGSSKSLVCEPVGRESSGLCQGCSRSKFVKDVPGLYPLRGGPPPPYFSQVFILKLVKVLCFDTLLQVFILKVVTARPLDSSKLPTIKLAHWDNRCKPRAVPSTPRSSPLTTGAPNFEN